MIAYLSATLAIAGIGSVYTYFGHGITSKYMTFAFVFPLAAGIICYIINALGLYDRFFVNAMNASMATITVGSVVKGILEIAGATTKFLKIFWLLGIVIAAVGAIRFIIVLAKRSKTAKE